MFYVLRVGKVSKRRFTNIARALNWLSENHSTLVECGIAEIHRIDSNRFGKTDTLICTINLDGVQTRATE